MLDPWFKRTYPLKHLKKWLYWPWAEYRALRDAAAVLFTCDEERLLARQSFRLYSANEKVVPYGSTGPIGNAEEHRKTFFSQYPQLSGKRIAVCMGRIHRKKGCDIAIRAFAQELAADPAWQLMFCGPDQTGWQAELESLAGTLGVQDRVTWTGMLKGDLKWGALRASEIFFLPSHQENFGIVVAEALSCGLPVLISNKINIWREIAADEGGLVGDDTLDGASSLLRQWVALPGSDQETMRRRALECFSNHFEMQRSGHAWVTLLQQVIAERRHRNTAGAFQPAV
jgi:glycosyltransferase involved in cell wall biosynthesis